MLNKTSAPTEPPRRPEATPITARDGRLALCRWYGRLRRAPIVRRDARWRGGILPLQIGEHGRVIGPVWKSTSVSGAPDNSSLSHFSAMTRPSWLGRAARNRHRHAIEQASRRWRGTSRKILISTQVLRGSAAWVTCNEAPEGEPSALEAINVFERRDGRWRVSASEASPRPRRDVHTQVHGPPPGRPRLCATATPIAARRGVLVFSSHRSLMSIHTEKPNPRLSTKPVTTPENAQRGGCRASRRRRPLPTGAALAGVAAMAWCATASVGHCNGYASMTPSTQHTHGVG